MKLVMSNTPNAPQKNRGGVGASCAVLFIYLHTYKFIHERYKNKENHDALIGIIIIRREFRIVTRRVQICIFMNHDDFEFSDLICVQRRVKVDTEGGGTCVLIY